MPKIFVYDEFSPEDTAMMQALYSRSGLSVVEHVKKVKESGSGKFMERFYVGYGHASIADCGSTTLFIEGVSMLTAKAVEDWPLFSGQETSSRYIDFSKRPIIDPIKSTKSKQILDKWMKFYIQNQSIAEGYLKAKFPKKVGEEDGVYDKAIKARSFDILRGFLPAGITTQLSWHTNLRQAHDKLVLLKYHPLKEIKTVAEEMIAKLKEKYPKSFSHQYAKEQNEYRQFLADKYTYFLNKNLKSDFTASTNINKKALAEYGPIFKKRALKTGLPNFLAELGNVTFDFLLDFGSFRDIQRHRNGVCRMPLLTTRFGFNEWYLEQLPESVKKEAIKLIKEQVIAIKQLKATDEEKQYYVAMGFNVTCRVSYGLPATLYTTELRSGVMVHPTLRKIAH
ncbi:MAG: FAD-dependent thymidylate synthase, partial [Candidatus Vogelbacteria bacterium]|nr:FAD-dependent thymidylate synthase [Candidatus Vogelbacteria bacterium]